MLVFLITLILILSLLTVKTSVKIEGVVDVKKNGGYFKLRIFNFTAVRLHVIFDLKNRDFRIVNRKKKEGVNKDKDLKKFTTLLTKVIIKIIDIKELNIGVKYGNEDNAFNTAMVLGAVSVFVYSLTAVIKSIYKTEINRIFVSDFKKDAIFIEANGIIGINIANIIYSCFIAFKEYFRKKTHGKLIEFKKTH